MLSKFQKNMVTIWSTGVINVRTGVTVLMCVPVIREYGSQGRGGGGGGRWQRRPEK
jgi:hypothetical protein